MLLGGIKFLIGGVMALLTWSLFSVNSNSTFTVYNLILITVLIGGGVAYIVIQVRDYKPNRRLRDDNANLRRDSDDLQRRLDLAVSENESLKKSRDFEHAMAGALAAISESRAAATAEHTSILTAIHENTTAVRELAESPERRRSS